MKTIILKDIETGKAVNYEQLYFPHGQVVGQEVSSYVGGFGDPFRTIWKIKNIETTETNIIITGRKY